jgi:hypothetical protein
MAAMYKYRDSDLTIRRTGDSLDELPSCIVFYVPGTVPSVENKPYGTHTRSIIFRTVLH